jgi:DNA-binding transcriptional LysR family regulator
MDITTLEYFLDVAKCQSFSAAAEEKHISQSSLSKAIIRLETELGVKLFERNHHPVSLTPAGLCFYKDLQELLPLYTSAIRHLNAFSSSRHISLCVVPSATIFDLAGWVAQFREANPDVQLSLTECKDFRTAIAPLTAGEYDYVITHRPTHQPPQFSYTVLCPDELYALVPKGHPLDGRQSVHIADLNGMTFIQSSFTRTIVRDLAEIYDFFPGNVVYRDGLQRDGVFQLLRRTMGVSLFFESDIDPFRLREYFTRLSIDDVTPMPLVLLENVKQKKPDWCVGFHDFLLECAARDRDTPSTLKWAGTP